MAKYFTMKKDDEVIEKVHELSVPVHEAHGWKVVPGDTAKASNTDTPESKAAIKNLSGSMQKAIKPGSSQAKAFDDLGIPLAGEGGKQRQVGTIAPEVMEALSKVDDVNQRNELATTLFGDSANFILSKFDQDE